MKAFRYLTALGLGAAVSLVEAASPPQVQAQTPEPAETTALLAANLIPELAVEESKLAVEESKKEAIAQGDLPIEQSPDPIETEFLEEPASSPDPADQTSAEGEAEPVLQDAEPETAVVDQKPVDGVVETAPDGTSLIDTQPNLFRPKDADAVVVDTTEAITLEQAIEIARQNSPTIRVRQLEVERADAAVGAAEAALSPQLSTSTGLTQNGSATRTEQLYNEVNDNSQGTSDTTDKTHRTRLDANVRLDYNIIQPGRRAQIRAAQKQKEQAELLLNQELSQLRLDVSQDYYAVQEADEQLKISQSAVESALKSLQDAQALERAGVGTRFAVLQAEVQLANEEQNRINAISRQNQTRRALAQRLSIPENFSVASADNVQAAGQWEQSLEDSIVLAYRNRVELDNQLLNRDISDARREIALAATRPQLGLFAQVGPDFNFTDTRQRDNDSDNDARVGSRSGSLGYSIGLRMNWTFADGGASKANARQREIEKAIADEQFESTRDAVRREVENAFYSLQANFNNISTAKKGVQQASSALRLARLRFQAGVGTQSEVVDAERDLTTARGNEVTAILNYNRALVQMRRAVGETLVPPAYESPVE